MTAQQGFELRPFDPLTASDAELRAMHAFLDAAGRESWPDQPRETFEEYLNNLHNRLPSEEVHEWAVSRAGEDAPVGHASLVIWHGDANQHMANFSVNVLPPFRRRGIASRLLEPVAQAAQGRDRTLLQAGTTSHVQAGDAFLSRIGAKRVAEESISKLELSELNRDLMREWLERASALHDEFELGFWEGAYPEDELEAIAKLREVVSNSMPREEAEGDDDIVTVERVREWEEWLAKSNRQRWTAYVRERSTKRFAGYTEVVWRPSQPDLLHQWDTGVLLEYRNRGIGRWLKAAMIEKVRRERPQVQQVRTGNAASNASMLRINHEMGFKPAERAFTWQVALDKVFDYLAGREAKARRAANAHRLHTPG
jgi:GNAT superfamily N-acetyltransferase